MVYPKSDFKKYYLPVYLIWAILGPSLLLLSYSPYEESFIDIILFRASPAFLYRMVSFYLIFGLVWPLMITIYPAFFNSLVVNYKVENLFDGLSNPNFVVSFLIWVVAFYGPFISFAVALYSHKVAAEIRYHENLPADADSDEEYTWKRFLSDFL